MSSASLTSLRIADGMLMVTGCHFKLFADHHQHLGGDKHTFSLLETCEQCPLLLIIYLFREVVFIPCFLVLLLTVSG